MAEFLPLTDSLLLSRVHEAVLFLDGAGAVVSANERFFAWTSFAADQVVGHPVAEFWEDRIRWTDWLTVFRLAGAARDNEVLDLRTRGGDLIPVEVHLALIPGAKAKAPCQVLVLQDLRPVRLVEHLVHHDPLTGVSNRLSLLPRLEEELLRGERYGTPTALVLLDIDGFQALNHRWGPAFGDEVLRVAGAEIREVVAEPRFAGRWGSDEFLVLLPRSGPRESEAVAEALRRGLANRLFLPEGVETVVTGSLGATVAGPAGHDSPSALVARVSLGLERAKARGGNRVEFSP